MFSGVSFSSFATTPYIVNSDRSHGFWFVCDLCELTGVFGSDFWRWKWGLTSHLAASDIDSGRLQHWWRRDTGPQSARGPDISFEIQEAVLLVSELRAEVTFLCRLCWRRMKSTAIFFLHDWSCGCSYLIVWPMGEFDFLLCTQY